MGGWSDLKERRHCRHQGAAQMKREKPLTRGLQPTRAEEGGWNSDQVMDLVKFYTSAEDNTCLNI